VPNALLPAPLFSQALQITEFISPALLPILAPT
jgi:hypothetical protein